MQRHVLLRGVAVAVLLTAPAVLSAQTPSDFFRDDTIQEIRLTVEPSDWQTLRDRYLEDTYYPADFEWNGVAVRGIGIRSRGSGSRTPLKPSLNLDFSRYTSSQRFLTMKSFILRNLSQDASMMHERLTLLMFARAGLPSLRSTHVRLYINGQYYGLFLAVEPIDKRFLTTRVGEDTGYLYQMQWTGTGYAFEYLGDDPSLYVPGLFEPKTKEDAPDAEHLVKMIRVMNEAPDSEFAAAMSKFIDLPAFVSHVAVEQFMAEGDGVLGDTGMTNFYFYRRSADDRMLFFVWDKDGTFSHWQRPVWQNTERNVLMRRALAVPELRRRYMDTLHATAEAAEGAGGWLAGEVERVFNQIRQAALEDPNRVCLVSGENPIGPCPAGEFERWVDWVRTFARVRRDFVRQELMAAGYALPSAAVTLAPRSVTTAASATGSTVLAPGALAMIRVNLPMASAVWASSAPLPTTLGGVGVEIGGVAAPLVMVSARDVEFQVPWELPCGPTGVVLIWRGERGNAVTAEIRPGSPSIFAVTHADGRRVTATEPAQRGEMLVAWANALGLVKGDITTGSASPMAALRSAVSVYVGGETATVAWAGLAPGFVGLDQVIFGVPANAGVGNALPLVIVMNGEEGLRHTLAVR